jgi:peptidoglycan/xylan/chitin deacetylase (PgdA/CDA1 family)
VPATVFMTGAMADNENTDAGRQVLAIVADHPDLFELGNHSYSHPDFRTLTAAQMADELRRTEEAIARAAALDPKPLFRPPYGGWNDAVLAAVGKAGYSKTVMWDVDTIDWRPTADGGPTADDIVARVVSQAERGSIVLMHLGGFHTLEALPRIVSELQSRGYELVTVGELLGL